MTPEDVRYSILRFILSDVSGGPSSLLLEPILGYSSTRDEQGNIVVDFKEAAEAVQVQGDNVVIPSKKALCSVFGRSGALGICGAQKLGGGARRLGRHGRNVEAV